MISATCWVDGQSRAPAILGSAYQDELFDNDVLLTDNSDLL